MAERESVEQSRSVAERAITAVLTSAPATAIKRAIRDVKWSVKGSGLTNPPWPSRVESIVFVCLGNICRSPFAAVLTEKKLAEAGRSDIRCESAGIRANQAGRAPEEACAVAGEYGLSLQEHRPTKLTRELIDRHDLVVVMEVPQLEQLRQSYPDAASRIVLLSLLDPESPAGYQRYHITDPFMQPRTAFEACYRRIDRATSNLLRQLSPEA